MTVNIERDYELISLNISGILDTATAPNLEKTINELPEGTQELVIDMSDVEFISSAGIRVLLYAYKKMNLNKGTMRIEKANEQVYEVFELTGLSEMFK